VREGRIRSAHDVTDGGLAVALAECAFTGPMPIGAEIALADTIRPDALLFGESTGRVIATTVEPDALLALARERGVPVQRIGRTGGSRLEIGPPRREPWIDASLERLHGLWARAIPRRLEDA
jgi:phosphoribosylformylglycinamidine synthase